MKLFVTPKKIFAFRAPVKYSESAHAELGHSGDGKRTIFLSPA